MSRMLSVLSGWASLVFLGGVLIPQAAAQQPLYAVTHVDIAGTGAFLDKAITALREFQADSQKDPGVVRFELLQQEGHPNHFTIYEVWQTRKAFEAHLAAEHTKHFRQQVQAMLGSPFRERLSKIVR
jgi:quinol monooxygenase YgiN